MGKGTAGAVRARRAEVAYRALPAFVMKSRRAAILAVFLADVFAYTGASSPLATKNPKNIGADRDVFQHRTRSVLKHTLPTWAIPEGQAGRHENRGSLVEPTDEVEEVRAAGAAAPSCFHSLRDVKSPSHNLMRASMLRRAASRTCNPRSGSPAVAAARMAFAAGPCSSLSTSMWRF